MKNSALTKKEQRMNYKELIFYQLKKKMF